MGNKVVSLMASKILTLPVVVVLGETGTGKSKLAIELARKFNGEIISADSMQVYKGLDIVTNKVTVEEQSQAVHHFINCVDSVGQYTVVDFRNQALPLIKDLIQKKKLPIIVGGTNYYIESLLWKVLVKAEDNGSDKLVFETEKNSIFGAPHEEDIVFQSASHSLLDSECIKYSYSNIFENAISQESLKDIPSDMLHKVLAKVDPAMASALHPNDKRKIVRSLQVYQQCKRSHTDVIKQQKSQIGGSSLGGPLRFKNSLMLWIQCDREVLNKRLDERVDEMIVKGLVNEMLQFHKMYNENRIDRNRECLYQEGIFQSIGFKEFHEYLILPEQERLSETGIKMCERAVEDVKIATKRYAKKQVKWIRNRFLKKPDREVPPVYALNATDVNLWKEQVFEVACDIVESFLKGTKPNIMPLPLEKPDEEDEVKESHYCEICDRVIVGRKIWQIHLNSRKHQNQARSKRQKTEKSTKS